MDKINLRGLRILPCVPSSAAALQVWDAHGSVNGSAFESLLVKKWNWTSCVRATWKNLLLDAVTALVTQGIQGNCSHSEVHDQMGCRWKPPQIPTEQNCSGICDMRRSQVSDLLPVQVPAGSSELACGSFPLNFALRK